jgi:hypothetical protein
VARGLRRRLQHVRWRARFHRVRRRQPLRDRTVDPTPRPHQREGRP